MYLFLCKLCRFHQAFTRQSYGLLDKSKISLSSFVPRAFYGCFRLSPDPCFDVLGNAENFCCHCVKGQILCLVTTQLHSGKTAVVIALNWSFYALQKVHLFSRV